MNQCHDTLEALVEQRIAAKAKESDAIERRREIDAAIVERISEPGGALECTVIKAVGAYKLTAKYSLTRKVDADQLRSDWAQLTPAVQDAFRFKAEVSLAGLRHLDAQEYGQAARFIEAKPATTSIDIKAA